MRQQQQKTRQQRHVMNEQMVLRLLRQHDKRLSAIYDESYGQRREYGGLIDTKDVIITTVGTEGRIDFKCTPDLCTQINFHTHPKIGEYYPSLQDLFSHMIDSLMEGVRRHRAPPYAPHSSVILCDDRYVVVTDSPETFEIFETFLVPPQDKNISVLRDLSNILCTGLITEQMQEFINACEKKLVYHWMPYWRLFHITITEVARNGSLDRVAT